MISTMNIRFIKSLLATVCLAIVFNACGDKEKKFIVQGTINNADSLTLFLERRGHSELIVLDSVQLTSDGVFSFKQKTLDYPEFYRLRLANQSLNFSIDSTETITINADKSNFSTDYKVEGSHNSTKIKEAVMMQLDFRRSLANLRKSHEQKALSDQIYLDSVSATIETYKRQASNMILDDYTSTAAYFILFQNVDDMLIFDPTIKTDLNLFRAVATVWDTYYPTSPRSLQLKNYTLKAIANFKALQSQEGIINMLTEGKEYTENKDYFAFSLPGLNGKEISTKSLIGKIAILDFTVYTTDYSLAHNVRLNQIYQKHKSKLEIYQVSFDQDKHKWSNAATNLPWICVWDNQSLNSPLIPKFNIETLPSIYILDKDGNIVKKLGINEDLEKEISKLI